MHDKYNMLYQNLKDLHDVSRMIQQELHKKNNELREGVRECKNCQSNISKIGKY